MTVRIVKTILVLLICGVQNVTAQNHTITLDYAEEQELMGRPIIAHSMGYTEMAEFEGELIPHIVLSDIIIMPPLKFKSAKQMKKYYKIAANIKKVYPIALDIQKTINKSIAHLDSLKTKSEKDRYMKFLEKDLMKQYKPRMKKLTLAQGKLLIKLIDRQCNQTSYDLIRTYIGKHRAWWWNLFASTFQGASLKKEYDPDVDDRLTERCILLIESGQM
ncbi:MAG: DUF4294 domain-containing protein [Prevotellaceae bacterium]|nr:DUF4294 domain-containing protein [Candidatus Colivivens equi]